MCVVLIGDLPIFSMSCEVVAEKEKGVFSRSLVQQCMLQCKVSVLKSYRKRDVARASLMNLGTRETLYLFVLSQFRERKSLQLMLTLLETRWPTKKPGADAPG
jgi:hypothetical protein